METSLTKVRNYLVKAVVLVGLFLLGPSCQEIQHTTGLVGLPINLQGEDVISTSFADADQQSGLPDQFSPTRFESLLARPRSPSGAFLLQPGAYELTVESFCLHAGTHGPSAGDGYLYAPLKGSKADLIHTILAGVEHHPEIPQTAVQSLIWSIEAHAKITDLSPEVQQAASVFLTQQQIFELNGGALGLIPQSVLDLAMASAPTQVQQALAIQANLRGALESNATFAEIERIAVLAGPPTQGGPMIPRGRWSHHPGGFFVRYLPSGYPQTTIQVYVPGASRSSHASIDGFENVSYRIVRVAAGRGDNMIPYDPTSDVAAPANTDAQRLGMSSRLKCDTYQPNNAKIVDILNSVYEGGRNSSYTVSELNVAFAKLKFRRNHDCCNLELAAAEHYASERIETAIGGAPAFRRSLVQVYDEAKKLGIRLKSDENCPVSEPTDASTNWAMMGDDDGLKDTAAYKK